MAGGGVRAGEARVEDEGGSQPETVVKKNIERQRRG